MQALKEHLSHLQLLELSTHTLAILKRHGENDLAYQIFGSAGIALESATAHQSIESLTDFFGKVTDSLFGDISKTIRKLDEELAKRLSQEIKSGSELHADFLQTVATLIDSFSENASSINSQLRDRQGETIDSSGDTVDVSKVNSFIETIKGTPGVIGKLLSENKPGPGWSYTKLDSKKFSVYADGGDNLRNTIVNRRGTLAGCSIQSANQVVSILKAFQGVKVDFNTLRKEVVKRASELMKSIPRDTENQKDVAKSLRQVVEFLTDCDDIIGGMERCLYDGELDKGESVTAMFWRIYMFLGGDME